MTNMKLFLVSLNRVTYGRYKAAVIACESEEKLEEILKNEATSNNSFVDHSKDCINIDNSNFDFRICKDQQIKIKEIGYTTVEINKDETIILYSCAGE